MTTNSDLKSAPTKSRALKQWVEEVARLTTPDQVIWLDGSEAERRRLTDVAIKSGALIALNPAKKPESYLHRSSPTDVARTEQLTFICAPNKRDAGPTNNWADPAETYAKLRGWLKGAMRGRTMYVIPYVMGPLGSPFAKVGVEVTDSVYVALNMRIMTRMGRQALEMLGDSDHFCRGLHATLDLNPERRLICHFPQDDTIWSVGSGYGGNALLSKKCFALRIASVQGRREGWLAEHMLIVGIQNPHGETRYVAAAFPSACGKTNLAMLMPPAAFPGWKVFTIGDDIAWLKVGSDGRLWAVNPENGYFGVAPGTNPHSNPNAMKMVSHDSIFTNVALTPDGDVWWEGIDTPAPDGLLDWQGRPFSAGSGQKAAHPNSRFTTPMTNNPALSPHANDPRGVPISAIIFGGRRASTTPLVLESEDWRHGVFMGATMGSETTAAASGAVGVVRRDPMAMLPFCGYNVGDYFGHWLEMEKAIAKPPKIFMVNWFRKDSNGNFLWPGFGDNLRVLKWMLDRIDGRADADRSPVGRLPKISDLDINGLEISPDQLREDLAIKPDEWQREMASAGEFFDRIGDSMPPALREKHRELSAAVAARTA